MEEEIIKKLKLKIAISEIKNEKTSKINKYKNFINRKLAIVACACIIFTTGIVFAKDIETYVTALFNNSTEAIDEAVENGYIQTTNMNFVYDNNIGIKVDNLILDNLNLDISICFITNEKNIKSIYFKDFSITNENDRAVYESEIKYVNSLEKVPIANSFSHFNEPVKSNNGTFIDSVLLGLREHNNELNELKFDIRSLNIVYEDNTIKEIDGTWKFNVIISDEMKKSTTTEFVLSEPSKTVQSCTGTLGPTGMNIKLELKESFDLMEYTLKNAENMNDIAFFYLKNNDELIAPASIEIDNLEQTKYVLRYDKISSFSNNVNKIEVYLEPFDTTIILIPNDI